MEKKICKAFGYYLIVWIVIVFIFVVFFQGRAINDGNWNHAASYSTMNARYQMSWHEWIVYAFWVPIDTPGENPHQVVTEEDSRSFTDWMTTLLFFGLFLLYMSLVAKSLFAKKDRYKTMYMCIVLALNIWLLIDTIRIYDLIV